MARFTNSVFIGPGLLCFAIVVVFILELVFGSLFYQLGIRPRQLGGLVGIWLSPFLHTSFSHLTSNIVPLFIMGCMLSTLNKKRFVARTVILITFSGLLTWLISSSGTIIGASGLVFAYWSFLIVNGFRARTFKSIVLSLITIVVYGAMVLGLFRYMPGISWAGHLSGAVAGGFLAIYGKR